MTARPPPDRPPSVRLHAPAHPRPGHSELYALDADGEPGARVELRGATPGELEEAARFLVRLMRRRLTQAGEQQRPPLAPAEGGKRASGRSRARLTVVRGTTHGLPEPPDGAPAA